MIWYNKQLTIAETPPNLSVWLVGLYNGISDVVPLIQFKLIIKDEADRAVWLKILFEDSPAMLQHEEPDAEDVLAKYNHKVQKIFAKLSGKTFDKLQACV